MPINPTNPSSSSRVTNNRPSKNNETPRSKEKSPQNIKSGAAKQVQKSDLAQVAQQDLQDAYDMASSMGLAVADVLTPDGNTVSVPTNLLLSWGLASANNSQTLAQTATTPNPEEYLFAQTDEGQVLSDPSNPGGDLYRGGSGGSIRQGFTSVAGGASNASNFNAYGNTSFLNQNQMLFNTLINDPLRDQAYTARRQMRQSEQQLQVKMRAIMLMILMGNIVGAVRAFITESERLNKQFNRQMMSQLDKVRKTKSKILEAMSTKKPPRANPNLSDPRQGARDQYNSARYTQWVSVNNQLMSEVQQTERELMDGIQSGRKNINDLWEFIGQLGESESRATRAVISRG